MIANALFTKLIPYRYECQLTLDDIRLFPDFTILHPKNKTIYYWEHFGLMDNENYRNNAFGKLKLYSTHHIIPDINLITTYETSDHPLDSLRIQNIIENFFK